MTPAAEPFSVLPSKQWEQARKRLHEESLRTAKLVLNRTDLKVGGGELPYKLMPNVDATNNLIAAFQLVNKGVAGRVGDGKKRTEWSTEEFSTAMAALPGVLNALVREIKALQHAKG